MTIHTRRASRTSRVGACMLTATAVVTLGGVAAAQTADPDAPVSVKVGYSDLNLASEAGAKAMVIRIQSAASRACGEARDLRDLSRVAIYNQCRSDTIARAVRTLDSPQVAALAGEPAPAVALSRK